mmetsp:Transcript_17037/g.58715  ORF Transcript_17037/g.58715 Transcript_17037/m.58715 type:complete len:287 (+) Transcript_17037:806-1666(+)
MPSNEQPRAGRSAGDTPWRLSSGNVAVVSPWRALLRRRRPPAPPADHVVELLRLGLIRRRQEAEEEARKEGAQAQAQGGEEGQEEGEEGEAVARRRRRRRARVAPRPGPRAGAPGRRRGARGDGLQALRPGVVGARGRVERRGGLRPRAAARRGRARGPRRRRRRLRRRPAARRGRGHRAVRAEEHADPPARRGRLAGRGDRAPRERGLRHERQPPRAHERRAHPQGEPGLLRRGEARARAHHVRGEAAAGEQGHGRVPGHAPAAPRLPGPGQGRARRRAPVTFVA